MAAASYVIGIDLGTSNCAVAFAENSGNAVAQDFPIPQLRRAGEIATQPLLPSSLYIPSPHELPAGSTRLPWEGPDDYIVGEFARWQGSRVPGRLVASAKSWLCHGGVDRSASILPWGAPSEVPKLSPVEASARLLRHMAAAWNRVNPDAPAAEQEIVITVPASFDEAARALTVTAAQQAGLDKFTLLEEPQAAFYDFAARHEQSLASVLREIRLILVVDVGGGTTDFTLVQAGISPEGPTLRRIAVGDHLLLGGDNMDAALGRMLEQVMTAGGRKLSTAQWLQLVQSSRAAKESLLGENPPDRHPIVVAAEGSRLLGGTFSAELARAQTEEAILDGFFPFCASTDAPRRATRTALQELGLPYANDPAITRHLAGFLRQHARAGWEALGNAAAADAGDALPRPDAILLNGGVFNSLQCVDRLVAVASSWWPESPRIPLLPHASLSLAVARGAAHYGLVRRGAGRRISGGSAQAFYVGLAGGKDSQNARAVCLIPRGFEEGQSIELSNQPFKLTLGRPVQLPLFSTTAGRVDRAGDIVEVTEDFHSLPPIHTLFKTTGNQPTAVAVHLHAALTELGTLELWCVSQADQRRWRLEFDLRAAATRPTTSVTEAMPPAFPEARAAVERVFGSKSSDADSREARQLFRALEKTLGARHGWRVPLLRELWSVIFAGAKRRRRSADHERSFLQLTGYCLRPGFGYPLDEWRCEQMFKVFEEGVVHHGQTPVWNEFWVLWRRISGGLPEASQQRIWDYLKPHLARRVPFTPVHLDRPKGPQPEGLDEMIRAAASMELIDPAEKTILGDWIMERMRSAGKVTGPWGWAIGRLGARAPIYGSAHQTVSTGHVSVWITQLLEKGLDSVENGAFAVAQMSRMTGDRLRDLDPDLRHRVIDALRAAAAPETWIRMVSEVTVLEAAEESQALGDALPVGLRLH